MSAKTATQSRWRRLSFANDYDQVLLWACSEVFGEPHQVAIRILDEKLALAALIVANSIPNVAGRFVERPFGGGEFAQKRLDAVDRHLEIDPAPERSLHLADLPASVPLAEHHLQRAL